MNNQDLKKIVPGFTMGIARAIISHPFEIMKIKSQIGHKGAFYKNLFKGVHYSILTVSLERGIQFGLYEKFKSDDNILKASAKASVVSTTLGIPYSIVLLRNIVMKSTIKIPRNIFYKSGFILYGQSLTSSILFLSSYNYLKDKEYPIFIRAPLASSFVWSLTYPIDTYRNLLLSNNNKKLTFKNLYKGIQYPLIRSIPSSIIGFYVYEYMLKIMK